MTYVGWRIRPIYLSLRIMLNLEVSSIYQNNIELVIATNEKKAQFLILLKEKAKQCEVRETQTLI